MFNLGQIDNWKKYLGLLPINLFLENEKNSSYILHNGGKGDFCLSFEEHNPIDLFSRSWSSNTNNYLTLDNDFVKIYNWKKKQLEPEKIPISAVSNNYDKFYEYLVDKNYRSGDDITPYVLNIFRQLRNMLNEDDGGNLSLNLLFNLLAMSEDNVSIGNINKNKWGLIENIDFNHLEGELDFYISEFKNGIYGLKPNTELIIRHTAGMLFQEAHQDVAFFNKQMSLFGSGYLSDVKYKEKFFSSTHYTPTYIARTIVENVLDQIDLEGKQNLKIFDPSCGTSIFLLETLKQLIGLNYKGNVEVIGWDISEVAINTSRFILSYEKREWKERLNINLQLVSDSLDNDWDDDYDIILMNPPFISWEQLDKAQRDKMITVLEKNYDKKPNLASAFLFKACKHISENGGVLGCVLPSSIFTYDSYNALRKKINEFFNFSFVGKLGNYVFENAITDVTIMTGSKVKTGDNTLVLWADNKKGVVSDSIHELRKFKYNRTSYISKNDYSIYYPEKFPINSQNWKPLSIDDDTLVKDLDSYVISGALKRISDIFTVKQGIRTGSNSVFKVSREFYESVPLEEKIYFKPAIDNEAINKGRIVSKNSYLWYPYDSNGLIINSEQELMDVAHFYYTHILEPNKNSLVNRARKDNNDWWTLSEHRSWLRTKEPRLVSTEFGGSDSFAFDECGDYLVERGNAWIPKKKITDVDFYYFYLAIFSSPFFNRLLSIYSKQLLKGNDLGAKHTKDIPVPDFFNSQQNTKFIAQIGRKLHNGEMFDTKVIDDYIGPFFPSLYTHS